MTREDVEAWRHRWKLVNDAEREELRRMTVERKWERLENLVALVRRLGWDDTLREGEAEVWERWCELRRAYAIR